MDPIAPLGREMDTTEQRCTYSPGDVPENDCGRPATWHIAWTTGPVENGLACDEHMAEAQRRFVYADRHPVCPDCSMPGSLWFFQENRCGYPDDPEQPVAKEARTARA